MKVYPILMSVHESCRIWANNHLSFRVQHHAVMTSLLALNKDLLSVNLQISSTPGLKSRQTKHLAIGEFEAHKASFQVISRTNASHSHKAPHLSSFWAARA